MPLGNSAWSLEIIMQQEHDGFIGVLKKGTRVTAFTRTSGEASLESLSRLDQLIMEAGLEEQVTREADGLHGMTVTVRFENGVSITQAKLCLKALLASAGVMQRPMISRVNRRIVGAHLRVLH
jgi:hypothetical protein